jgi:hypothetical protein
MTLLPHSLIHNILEFLFNEDEMRPLKGINLELEDAFTLKQKAKNQEYLLKEFVAKTSFWRIRWLNRELDFGLYPPHDKEAEEDDDHIPNNTFNNTRTQLTYISEYWNYHYPNYYALSPLKNKQNCDEEYITDRFKKSKKILKNLKMLKDYVWSSKHKNLFKPGRKEKLRPVWYSRGCCVMEGDL